MSIFLAIVSNAAVYKGVHICLFELVFLFSLGEYTGVERLDHTVVLFLILGDPPYCFPQWLQGFPFLHILTHTSYLSSLS